MTITLKSAVTGEEKHLGTAKIVNDGTGSKELGNYEVSLSKWGRPNQPWKTAEIKGFPRLKLGPYDLLYRALKAAVGGRNGP